MTKFMRFMRKNHKLELIRLNATRIDSLTGYAIKVNGMRFYVHVGNYDDVGLFYCRTDSLTVYATSLQSLKRKLTQFDFKPFELV